jgi:hypothetical protein
VASDLAPNETPGSFQFHVRRTCRSSRRLCEGDIVLDEQLPRDPRVKVRPLREGPGRVCRVSFRARITERPELNLRHPGLGCDLPSGYSLPFRRGRATLLIGSRLKPGRRRGNVWAIRPASRTVPWNGAGFGKFDAQDVGFGFTVVS